MDTPNGYPLSNRLWHARKRRRLQPKQVAYLINHKTSDQIIRYEKGERDPPLHIALMLEIIYATPIRVLFKEHYEHFQADIYSRLRNNKVLSLPGLNDQPGIEDEEMQDFCAYAELLGLTPLSPADLNKVRNHVTHLAKHIARI
jgi:DNA-binding XRE family transcriptional regulator